MSFKADLKINDGGTYRVFHCHYAFHQAVDQRGFPHGGSQIGIIQLEIQSTADLSFVDWLDKKQLKDGKITFYHVSGDQTFKEIAFTEAYLVDYAETFSNFGKEAMMVRITLSCHKLDISAGGSHKASVQNIWNNDLA